jgi:hypothetical protein
MRCRRAGSMPRCDHRYDRARPSSVRAPVSHSDRSNIFFRQHGEPRALAHGFAYGVRGIEKNGSVHSHDLALGLIERETPCEVITQRGVGDERKIGNVFWAGEASHLTFQLERLDHPASATSFSIL